MSKQDRHQEILKRLDTINFRLSEIVRALNHELIKGPALPVEKMRQAAQPPLYAWGYGQSQASGPVAVSDHSTTPPSNPK